jgi:GT2 family glycosyltransferase
MTQIRDTDSNGADTNRSSGSSTEARFGVMTLSIVIGTRGRPDSLARCLDSIVTQTRLPTEVLIIDDGALEPAPLLDRLQRVGIATQYVNKSHDPGLTKSRNLGIRRSVGAIVMFLDDDVELAPRYLEAVLGVYESHPEAFGVGGRLIGAPLSWAKRLFLQAFLLDGRREGAVLSNGVGVLVRDISRVTRVDWLSGCNMSYRREVFDRYMFDEDFAGNGWGDDRDFSYSVSREFTLMCAPDAEVRHFEEPKARAGDRQFGRTEIAYVHRFFIKHMPQRPRNLLALWWSFAGIVLKNAFMARGRRVRGNLAGLAAVLSHHGDGSAP